MTRGGRRSALSAFVRKETHHILRDRRTLVVLLLMPLVQVILFGYALRTDVREIRLAVVDAAPDALSIALRDRLAANPRVRLVSSAPTARALDAAFRRDALDAALVIDPRFAERVAHGERTPVQLIVDASDPNTGTLELGYLESIIAAFSADRIMPAGARIEPRVRMRYNPTLASANLIFPGLIALVMTIVSALMTAISLSREKERGTLEVLLVSPLRPWEIIVGKVVPYIALGFANVVTALLAARFVFGVPVRGSLALLGVESLLYIIVSLSLGVLIASRTSSQRTAMLGALVGLMMPTIILSGLVIPIASIPAWIRPITALVPARWFIVIARGIMLKGVGIVVLWRETAILAAMAVPLLVVSIRSFHVRLD